MAKDAGLKIVAHTMPGLPGSDFEKDLSSFKQLFQDQRFCPDMLKIYPCLVMEGTELYEWWARGDYQPYDTEQAAELIARVKQLIPPWVRIMRVHREFPVKLIIAGVKNGNLRELALQKLAAQGKRCQCIRCRGGTPHAQRGVVCRQNKLGITFVQPKQRKTSWLVPAGIAALFVAVLGAALLPALSRSKSRGMASVNQALKEETAISRALLGTRSHLFLPTERYSLKTAPETLRLPNKQLIWLNLERKLSCQKISLSSQLPTRRPWESPWARAWGTRCRPREPGVSWSSTGHPVRVAVLLA